MTIERASRPNPEIGSKEWVHTLSVKETEHGRSMTNMIEERAKEVLGEAFPERAWDKAFHPNTTPSIYTRARGHSLTAGVFIALSQKLDWSAKDPAFAYTSARMVATIAERLSEPKDMGDLVVYKLVDGKRVIVPPEEPEEISIDVIHDKLASYAEKEGIQDKQKHELDLLAGAPLLKDHKKSTALERLNKKGKDALIKYLEP